MTSKSREALDRLGGLTEREREVLVEIGLGHANAEIATRLHMSEATVKSHVSHLFDKLTVTNRVQWPSRPSGPVWSSRRQRRAQVPSRPRTR